MEQISCLFRVKSTKYHYEQEGVGIDYRDSSFFFLPPNYSLKGKIRSWFLFLRLKFLSQSEMFMLESFIFTFNRSFFSYQEIYYFQQIMLVFIICVSKGKEKKHETITARVYLLFFSKTKQLLVAMVVPKGVPRARVLSFNCFLRKAFLARA